jgi:quercetin dioxygenase-like cupin family protein
MRVAGGRTERAESEQRGATFSGKVWADPVLAAQDGVVVNNVFFEPGARTHWHTHEVGQVLHVLSGDGWLQVRGGDGHELTPGDVAHIPAGEVH